MRPGTAIAAGRDRKNDWGTGVLIVLLLTILYLLTYSGIFTTDDEHILASRAISLALDGSLNDNRVLGNERIQTYLHLPDEQAQQSLNIEPFQAWVGSLLVFLSLLLNTGRVQTLFLLNILATGLTALFVYRSTLALGYSHRTATVTSLLFGLGTQAWPYTRTFFRDPLAMCFLALAYLSVIELKHTTRSLHRLVYSLGIVLGMTGAILSKNTTLLSVPALIYLLVPLKLKRPSSKGAPTILWIGILLACTILLIVFLYFASGPFSRFNIRYYIDLVIFFFNSPHPNLLIAVAGILVSPGKSIFLYSPVLLLSLPGIFMRQRAVHAAWIYALLLILAQVLFYDQNWWGSVNWGLRFFMPAIPLLIVASTPFIEWVLNKKTGKFALGSVSLLAIMIQLAGCLAPVNQYYLTMMNISPEAAGTLGVWNIRHSAITWHLQWLLSWKPWDLTAVKLRVEAIPVVVFLAILFFIVAVALFRIRAWFIPTLTISVLVSMGILLYVYAQDPAYASDRGDLIEVQQVFSRYSSSDDLLAVASYGTPAWYYWMNWGDMHEMWFSLPYELYNRTTEDIRTLTLETPDLIEQDDQDLWLLLPCGSPGSQMLYSSRAEIFLQPPVEEYQMESGTCITHLLRYQIARFSP